MHRARQSYKDFLRLEKIIGNGVELSSRFAHKMIQKLQEGQASWWQ